MPEYRVTFIAPAAAEHPSRDEILGALSELLDDDDELDRQRPHITSGTPKEIQPDLAEYAVQLSGDNADEIESRIRQALAAKGAEPKELHVKRVD